MKPLSIYIHIPFCEKKCAYCDFVSYDNLADKVEEYINALCNEIKRENIKHADTIFFGGGTPSILTNDQISKIFALLPKVHEITIEANPNSITEVKLKHWLSVGINRISIGVQSFDDTVLKTLGRIHTADQATQAIKLAYDCGFRNISIDLIHSVTQEHVFASEANQSLLEVLPYITHVSPYCLIIEPHTKFANRQPMPENQSIKQQKQIEKTLKLHGFKKYEVSNFARSGFECIHNLAYWQPLTHEYIGFGLGAHSLFDNTRHMNTTDFDYYLKLPSRADIKPSPKDRELEAVMLGLRTTRGADISLFKNKSTEIEFLKSVKLVKQTKNRIVATEKGFLLLNQIIEKLT